MVIKISRKELNEQEDYSVTVEENDCQEAVSPIDETVIELLYEILKATFKED